MEGKKLTIDDLARITLAQGGHNGPEEGMCFLEAAALFAGEDFGDSPECVDPVIAEFSRAWNEGMRTDEEREQLKQYIPLIVGTRGSKELTEKRAWMATDWLIRVHAAAWLGLSPGLSHHAEALRALPPITCGADAVAAQPKLDAARSDARDAWDDAGDAAWDAAWAAAGDAAWDAAWAAAGDAAGDAAGAAAWDAAWDAAWAAAGDAAWAAAGDAARAAAGAAARAAAWAAARAAARAAAWAAARDAAWAAARALEPTVKTLQAAAHELLARMIKGE